MEMLRQLAAGIISTHALLAEGDTDLAHALQAGHISTHALLAEGDNMMELSLPPEMISTHALLAEGDAHAPAGLTRRRDFNPRPPCGGRQAAFRRMGKTLQFQPTPSLRRAT